MINLFNRICGIGESELELKNRNEKSNLSYQSVFENEMKKAKGEE